MAKKKSASGQIVAAGLVALSGVDLNAGPILKLKCSGCDKTRDVKPGEIGPMDFPMCDECYMPMLPVAVAVEAR